ncbi:hypothetical protein OHA02_51885 [Streptomyces phaeochromogenes]|nr:hypothetical protein [Streptomyces phaeochromogenes]
MAGYRPAPSPRGHLGQVILFDHEKSVCVKLVAGSLANLALDQLKQMPPNPSTDRAHVAAAGGAGSFQAVKATAHPALNVSRIGECYSAPFSLAPLLGLPWLCTFTARTSMLAALWRSTGSPS